MLVTIVRAARVEGLIIHRYRAEDFSRCGTQGGVVDSSLGTREFGAVLLLLLLSRAATEDEEEETADEEGEGDADGETDGEVVVGGGGGVVGLGDWGRGCWRGG